MSHLCEEQTHKWPLMCDGGPALMSGVKRHCHGMFVHLRHPTPRVLWLRLLYKGPSSCHDAAPNPSVTHTTQLGSCRHSRPILRRRSCIIIFTATPPSKMSSKTKVQTVHTLFSLCLSCVSWTFFTAGQVARHFVGQSTLALCLIAHFSQKKVGALWGIIMLLHHQWHLFGMGTCRGSGKAVRCCGPDFGRWNSRERKFFTPFEMFSPPCPLVYVG